MKIQFVKWASITAFLMLSTSVAAEVKIIAHPSVKDTAITTEQAADIFLGKANMLPGGDKAVAVDQSESGAVRKEFYSKVAKKDSAQLKAYWSRLIFTGKGQPPKELGGDAEVLQLVSSNPNIIGYVGDGVSTGRVKVLLTIP